MECTNETSQLRLAFPEGFLWGVATAAHQVEGGNTNNQWWVWEQQGHIHTGETSRNALDWWNNAEQDFEIAQHLGLNALRLSIEWSRIEPRPGEWNTDAIRRYRQMLVGLRDRGIQPLVTLHHFTNPLWFEDIGGWLSSKSVELFTRYVTHVVLELGDICDFWCTINEPNVYSIVGYIMGLYPPGHKGDAISTVKVQANMIRAHAEVFHAIHHLQPRACVGWAQNYYTFDPARLNSSLDGFAAGIRRAVLIDIFPRAILTGNTMFPLNLLIGDLSVAKDTCDFIGINTYYRDLVCFDICRVTNLFGYNVYPPGTIRSEQPVSDWEWGEVYPQGCGLIAERLKSFGKPLYVTENGVADGSDNLRPWVLARAIRAMHEAIANGADLRGYFHWTLVDNFEWAEGYSTRFGLVALDLKTQRRTPRPSADLYSHIIRSNALTPAMLRDFGTTVIEAAFPQTAR